MAFVPFTKAQKAAPGKATRQPGGKVDPAKSPIATKAPAGGGKAKPKR